MFINVFSILLSVVKSNRMVKLIKYSQCSAINLDFVFFSSDTWDIAAIESQVHCMGGGLAGSEGDSVSMRSLSLR